MTDIVVANGTYRVSTASSQASNSLWIGARFASRTNPVTVRAETTGGVVFDGGAADTFGGITFVAGAHDQTWDGFVWQNGTPAGSSGQGSGTGVVVFGGYAGMAAPHHITLRNCTIRPIAGSYVGGHAVYFSWAASPGAHDIILDGLTVDDPNGYMTAGFHFYHSDAANPNVNNVTIRNSHVIGTQQGVLLWDPTLRNITFADTTITNALRLGIQYQTVGSTGIVFRNVVTDGCGPGGFGLLQRSGQQSTRRDIHRVLPALMLLRPAGPDDARKVWLGAAGGVRRDAGRYASRVTIPTTDPRAASVTCRFCGLARPAERWERSGRGGAGSGDHAQRSGPCWIGAPACYSVSGSRSRAWS